MKKKLLITLGCSYTEGVGCYEPSLLDEKGNPIINVKSVYDASLDRFHTRGWPAQLQKKLRYDHLLNLGHGAASNSETVKRWFEVLSDKNLSDEYDVLVVWMVTFAGRISFYRNGKITSLLPNFQHGSYVDQNLYDSYVQFLGNKYNTDILLETYFYVNIIKNICSLSNYNFLYINVAGDEGKQLDSLLKSENSLNYLYKVFYPHNKNIIDEIVRDARTEYNAFCGHPKEKGYEVIAERLFNMISHGHPHLINNTTPSDYKIEYLGDSKQW